MNRKFIGLFLFSLALIVALMRSPIANSQPAHPARPADNPTGFVQGEALPGADYPPPALRLAEPRQPTTPTTPPNGFDLDVLYINRSPMYHAYCLTYPGGIPILCPGSEGDKRWPDPGEIVTFTAYVANKGSQPSPAFTYQWQLDDVAIGSGSAGSLAAGGQTSLTVQWAWGHSLDGERLVGEHRVRFTLFLTEPGDLYPVNNSLEDRTDALGFHIAITPQMVAAYNTPWNPAFSYSAEDWLQRQVAAMNGILEQSVYPTTPQGATERVRINTITVTAVPPFNDGTHDGGWFVDADYRQVSGGYDPITDVDWALIHELSHQIGLIDLYTLDIPATNVLVLDRRNQPSNFGFIWPNGGLMGGGDIAPHSDQRLYSSHTAAGVSSNKGYRRGYYGEYQFDLPAQIDLLVLDNQGGPAAGVAVALHQRGGPPDWMGVLAIDNTPEIAGVTDDNGRFPLPNRSVSGGVATHTGHTLRDNPFGLVDVVGGRNRFLINLGQGTHEEFHWLDITPLNLAYWAGETEQHTLVLSSRVPPAAAPEPPLVGAAQVEGTQATLCWQPQPGLSYRLYLAGPPVYAYTLAADSLSGPCVSHSWGGVGWGGNRVYGLTAVAPDGAESGFSNFVWAPQLRNPTAVRLDGSGRRVVLDPQNGYALLRQGLNGRYLQNFGSPHYHLEFSRFFTVDGDGRLIFSHPADYYSDRHSVRIADAEATPLLEFGEQGSGPGQFQTPAGVAVWGDPCTVEGPYEDDPHTLLLLHFDGSYEGTQGEIGYANPEHFGNGRYGQGAVILTDHLLTYPSAGNINRPAGAIEFWIRPEWDGDDGENYTFLEVGYTWFNRIRIMKDGANNLRFMIWSHDREYDIGTSVADWRAGDWHHVAATWSGSDSALFVDGQPRASRHDLVPPDFLAAELFIGSNSQATQAAQATFDELRISDRPRLGNSESCLRILVADQGNHRLQAFDSTGSFVAQFGEFGSGPGQFSQPRGLAVDSQGRILVADSGNHRLQRLAFDGHAFSFVEQITADFHTPYDVAAGGGRIVVADTGNHLVKVLDETGALLETFAAPNDGATGPFSWPEGVMVQLPGDIVVADTGRQRVVTIREALPVVKVYLPLVNGR